MAKTSILILMATVCATSFAFTIPSVPTFTHATQLHMAKGFGKEDSKPAPRVISDGQKKRDTESSKYDEISGTGGQEYSIFVRQFGSEDDSWLPCGAIAVPRGAQVTDAIYANSDALKKAITRTYVKLNGMEEEFEFGYNLKLYPDEPVEVAQRGSGKSSGPSLGNWVSNLLSPIDSSNVAMDSPPDAEKE
eukprot:CAMPEP_0198248690 /NCGR_PEP_ID=MMETSP1447-20131203/420_1 /TAXON_ID=420782 /ORGANISM="Chaetoceros dichaeta, Strain CCMP1751" /LENGTH=190 /DNA_ID=CAMNT_0043933163 /DNA_START=51 /DNA_END=623 /DNA_ORIENTATION=+